MALTYLDDPVNAKDAYEHSLALDKYEFYQQYILEKILNILVLLKVKMFTQI